CCAYARRGHAAAAAPRSRENLRRFTGHLRCCGRSGNPFNLPQTELGGMNEERGGPIFLPRGTRGGADPLDADATRRRPERGKGAVAIVKEVARPLVLGEGLSLTLGFPARRVVASSEGGPEEPLSRPAKQVGRRSG